MQARHSPVHNRPPRPHCLLLSFTAHDQMHVLSGFYVVFLLVKCAPGSQKNTNCYNSRSPNICSEDFLITVSFQLVVAAFLHMLIQGAVLLLSCIFDDF